MLPYVETDTYSGINNSPLTILGIFKDVIGVDVFKVSHTFYVVTNDTMTCDCLLGRDFVSCPQFKIVFNDRVCFEPVDLKVNSDFTCNEVLLIDAVHDSVITELDIESGVPATSKLELQKAFDDGYANPLLLFSYFNAMSDRQRHYFSGSQKRKLKEKKEQEKMKHTKLTQFFVPNKANLPGENEQTIISTIIEDKENVERTKCQPNTSQKTIDNENDTDSFQGQNYESTSSHTANRSFAKEYIGDADADLGKNAERYQNIALWPDSVDNEKSYGVSVKMSTNINIPDKMNPADPRFVNWAQNLLDQDDENLEFEESDDDFRDEEDVKKFLEESSDEDYFQNEGTSSGSLEDEPEEATENKEEFYFRRNKFKC
ncbi:hypothetical protein RN001_002464 [Aquatica leii]|uniref:Uncharacterized protein n=1 Tax=Aquatica leii TaxID=1421715 RepID=A0AAN7PH93_9COLE|nr:hypothetical protein RN001_002464 [Aquatica leii]